MINFDAIDRKNVTILCRNPENSQALSEYLRQKDFTVQFEKMPGAFFQSISKNQPGMVLISHEMNAQMGKVFPNFIHKKFKIPVLLFHEVEDKKDSLKTQKQEGLSNTIRSASQSSPEKIHEEIENLHKGFEDTVKLITHKQGSPEKNSERLQCQEEIVKKLDEKISAADNKLHEKEKLSLLSLKVMDPDGLGYFMFFTEVSEGQNKESLQQELMESLSGSSGADLVMEPVETAIHQQVFQKLKSNSDKVIDGYWGQQPMTILYYANASTNSLDQVTLTEDGYLVPVAEWWTKMPLLFDAYISLQVNQKKLLYLRRGDSFLERNIKKFSSSSQKILIKCEEFHAFEAMSQIANLAKI
jgi:hypothetical protein